MNSDKATEDILNRTKQRSREIEELLQSNDDTVLSRESEDEFKTPKTASPLRQITENQILVADTPKTNERRSRFAALSAQVEEFECDLKSDRTLARKENLLKGPPRRISVGTVESKPLSQVDFSVPPSTVATKPAQSGQSPGKSKPIPAERSAPANLPAKGRAPPPPVTSSSITALQKQIQEAPNATRKLSTSRIIRPAPASVKKLLSRWEVSSQIGVPLHPDRNNDELLDAAVHLVMNPPAPPPAAESSKPAVKRNFGSANNKNLSYQEIVGGNSSNSASSSRKDFPTTTNNNNECASSASKSPRIDDGYSAAGGPASTAAGKFTKVDMIVEEDQVDSMHSISTITGGNDTGIDFTETIDGSGILTPDSDKICQMSLSEEMEARPVPNNPKRVSVSNNSINASIDMAFSFISHQQNESGNESQTTSSNITFDKTAKNFEGGVEEERREELALKTPEKAVEPGAILPYNNGMGDGKLVEEEMATFTPPISTTSTTNVETLSGVGGVGTEQRKTEFITSLIDDINKDLEKYTPTFRRPLKEEDETPLTHTISFYRRQTNARRLASKNITDSDDINNRGANFDSTSSSSSTGGAVDSFLNPALVETPKNNEVTLKRLHEAILIQQDQICQASRALAFCQQNENFRGSREEVDAQRALLIATERRRAFMCERERLINSGKNPKESQSTISSYPRGEPRGTLTFSLIAIKLSRDFVNLYSRQNSETNRYYFIVLIKYGENVVHTTLENSDHGTKSGFIEFSHYIQLANLKPDFVCTLEVHALRTSAHNVYERSTVTEKSKKKTWMKTLSAASGASVISNLGSSSTSSSHHHHHPKPLAQNATSTVEPAFQKIGYINLTRAHLGREKFSLSEPMYPLDGNLMLNLRCFAEETPSLNHSGFLSLFQTVSNLASWTRFWSVLSNGQMRFWRYPEDEEKKKPVVSLELTDCLCDVTDVTSSTATFPHSMQVDVALKEEGNNSKDIRMVFAANSHAEKIQWMEAINQAIRNVNIWNCPTHRGGLSGSAMAPPPQPIATTSKKNNN